MSAATPLTSAIEPGGGLGAATKETTARLARGSASCRAANRTRPERRARLAVGGGEEALDVVARGLLEALVDEDLPVPVDEEDLRGRAPRGAAEELGAILGGGRAEPRRQRRRERVRSQRGRVVARRLELGDAQHRDHQRRGDAHDDHDRRREGQERQHRPRRRGEDASHRYSAVRVIEGRPRRPAPILPRPRACPQGRKLIRASATVPRREDERLRRMRCPGSICQRPGSAGLTRPVTQRDARARPSGSPFE